MWFIYRTGAFIFLSILLAGCSLPSAKASNVPTRDVFIPQSVATSTPRESLSNQDSGSSPEQCTNDLKFLKDLTIPDGSSVPAGSTLEKQWSIQNSGTCNWDKAYRLKLIAGTALGALTEQLLVPARGGSQAVINITFTAPSEPGQYRSAWQAFSPSDEPFGEAIFVDFIVTGP